MAYTKKQFIEDVKKEARALRKHATKAEIENLSFLDLSPRSASSCLYGQMTGNCFSSRAANLIHSCCKRYFTSTYNSKFIEEAMSCKFDNRYVNGKNVSGVTSGRELHKERLNFHCHFSSIEAYILLPNAKNKNLIAYLKGERNDLVL